jgi:ABC-2 type transport system ATP-binding protein
VVTSHDMAELEQLAGRIVLLHQGQIAFDGDFTELRGLVTSRRLLTLETTSEQAPELAHAELVHTESGRHDYAFDAVVADLYEHWLQAPTATDVRD